MKFIGNSILSVLIFLDSQFNMNVFIFYCCNQMKVKH